MTARKMLIGAASSLALSVMAFGATAQTVPDIPQVEGPIAEQDDNRMHPAIFYPGIRPYLEPLPAVWGMEYHGYVAEEYFISGTAGDEDYLTRIVVRRPADINAWSGFTILETMHTAGAAQAFTYGRVGAMKNGHAFVEIVDRAATVNNLKGYNEARYADLAFEGGEVANRNALAAQVAHMIRTAHPSGDEWNADILVMAGLSQTASNIDNFFSQGAQAEYQMADGSRLVDGILLGARNPPSAEDLEAHFDVPMIVLSTQGEWDGFTAEDVAAMPEDSDLYRHQMVSGMPHLDGRHFFATDPNNCELPIDHFMTSAYFYNSLEHLYHWVAHDIAPPNAPRPEFDDEGYVRDEFGNAVGGIRSPQLEVPTHTWITPNVGEAIQCRLAGTVEPLSDEELASLYRSAGDYELQLISATMDLISEGWFPEEYLFDVLDEVDRFPGR